jgi:hypothetical protein
MKHIIGLNGLIAAWLIVAPPALGLSAPGTSAMWNDVVLGLLLLGCAMCVAAEAPGAVLYAAASLCCGVWLAGTPFFFRSPPASLAYDGLIGALVIVISGVQTWRLVSKPAPHRRAVP